MINNRYKSSLLIFWFNILSSVLILLFLLWIKGPNFGLIEGNVILERYMIILTLIGIPGALKLYHSRAKKIEANKSEENDINKQFFNIYILRIAILDLVIIGNLISFYIYENTNFIYMSIITIFALAFTFPTRYLFAEENKELDESETIKEDNEE